ncbi:MAG TPA: lipocalin family protein [Flavobacteriaceae bacterium]|jgi:hypothetical protein
MKKLKSLFVILFIGLLTSCGSNNDNPDEVEASIVGTWKIISDIEDGIEYVSEDSCDYFWVFTETTFDFIEYWQPDCITQTDTSPVPYSIVDNMIIGIPYDEEEGIYYDEILELTETTLKIKTTDDTDFVNYSIWERQ